MLSLNSQPEQNGTSPAEKWFGHKLRTTFPSLIPFTQSSTTKKHTVTHNLKSNFPEFPPGTTVRIRTDEQNLWYKKGITMSQNNRPQSCNILNERENISARNRHYLILTTKKFKINNDYDIAIPVSNTSTHPNLIKLVHWIQN